MMFGRKLVASALAFAVAMGPSSLVLADPIMTNGTFSTNNGAGQLGYNTSITGWSTTPSGTGYTNAYDFLFTSPTGTPTGVDGKIALANVTAAPGTNFVALDANFEAGPLQQALSLTVGQEYQVSYAYAFAQQTGYSNSYNATLSASIEGVTDTHSSGTLASQTFSGWNFATFDFKATSTTLASSTLSFLASGGTGEPPFALVADVAVAAVPEPGSLVLVGIGVIGFGVSRLIRRKKPVTA